MPQLYDIPIAHHTTVIHAGNRGNTFLLRILLKRDWTLEESSHRGINSVLFHWRRPLFTNTYDSLLLQVRQRDRLLLAHWTTRAVQLSAWNQCCLCFHWKKCFLAYFKYQKLFHCSGKFFFPVTELLKNPSHHFKENIFSLFKFYQHQNINDFFLFSP